jgi:hypothetical protein
MDSIVLSLIASSSAIRPKGASGRQGLLPVVVNRMTRATGLETPPSTAAREALSMVWWRMHLDSVTGACLALRRQVPDSFRTRGHGSGGTLRPMTGTRPEDSRSVFEQIAERVVMGFLSRINPFMKRALASPFHWLFSRWFALLSFTGHKSGRRISTPASYFRRDDTLILTTKRPWWRSLEAAGMVEATVAGRRANRSVEIVKGEKAVAEALRGAPGWFLLLAALDDGRLGQPDEASRRRSARQGRVVLRLGSPTNARSGGTRGAPTES